MTIDPITLTVIQAGAAAGLRRDGPDVLQGCLFADHRRGQRPLGRHLCGRGRVAHRAGQSAVCRCSSASMQASTRTLIRFIERRALPAAGAGRHLHRQRSLSWRHASDGRAIRDARLSRRQDLLLVVQHRPLARHRRRGAGRLARPRRHRSSRRGCACPRSSCSSGASSIPEIYAIITLQHPRRRPAHRRHQGPGGGAAWSARSV